MIDDVAPRRIVKPFLRALTIFKRTFKFSDRLMAQKMGVHRSTVTRLRSGARPPTLATIESMLDNLPGFAELYEAERQKGKK